MQVGFLLASPVSCPCRILRASLGFKMYLTDFWQMKGEMDCLSDRPIIYGMTLWELRGAERQLSSYVSSVTLWMTNWTFMVQSCLISGLVGLFVCDTQSWNGVGFCVPLYSTWNMKDVCVFALHEKWCQESLWATAGSKGQKKRYKRLAENEGGLEWEATIHPSIWFSCGNLFHETRFLIVMSLLILE